MTRKVPAVLTVTFSLLLAAKPIVAHHSETAEYDTTKLVKVDRLPEYICHENNRCLGGKCSPAAEGQ